MPEVDPLKTEKEALVRGLPPSHKKMWEEADRDHRARIESALVYLRHGLADETVLEGPSPFVTSWWILGEHPTALGKGLTHREAGAWILQSEHEKPRMWLWAQIVADHPELEKVGAPRSIQVTRWLQRVMGSPERKAAALRHRRGIIAEAQVGGRVVDRLDEIRPVDLHKSPVRTLEAAQQRLVDQEWSGDEELAEEEPWHARLPPEATVLRHYKELRLEGVQMRHCAGAYASDVAEGHSVVLSVDVGGSRSTVEIRDGEVAQHVGFANGPPPDDCVRVVEQIEAEKPWAFQR